MGGNLFKGQTRRYSAHEYQQIESFLEKRINKGFGSPVFHSIPYYRNKSSFGDIDFVLDVSDFSDWKSRLIDILSLETYKSNGGVFSFIINDDFQADTIAISSQEEVLPAVHYYSYNDISNLLGRIAHKLGFKLSHRGSYLILRDPEMETRIISEILISRDYADSLNLLGLDPYFFFDKGFDTTEQMFQYVSSSPYFSKDIYLLHNRNHRSRIRDNKRKIYHEFLDWINNNKVPNNYEYSQVREHGGHGIREPHFSRIVDYVKEIQDGRDLRQEIQNILYDDNITKLFKKEYFNGNVISELTGLTGKQLGQYMSQIKQSEKFPNTADEKKYFMDSYIPEHGVQVLMSFNNEASS